LIASNARQSNCQRMATECRPTKEQQKCGSYGRARYTAVAYPCRTGLVLRLDQGVCPIRVSTAELTRRCARIRADACATTAVCCANVFSHQRSNPSAARFKSG
jgi:hypothetical protein